MLDKVVNSTQFQTRRDGDGLIRLYKLRPKESENLTRCCRETQEESIPARGYSVYKGLEVVRSLVSGKRKTEGQCCEKKVSSGERDVSVAAKVRHRALWVRLRLSILC